MAYTFRYSLTKEELADFNAYNLWHAPWQRAMRINFIIRTVFYSSVMMAATVIVLQKLDPKKQGNNSVLFLIMALFLIILVWISYYQAPFNIRNKILRLTDKGENANVLNETELEINENGIINTDKDIRIDQKWQSITKYVVTKNFFYLYMNSFHAHIIPKRLISSQEKIEELDHFLTQKIPLSSSFRSLGI